MQCCRKIFLVIGFSVLAINYGSGQAFTVVKATRQRWAGGVAGNYGVNYYIELEENSRGMIPDTVWINGNVFPIDSFSVNGPYRKNIDSVTRKTRYTIMASEHHMGFYNGRPMPADDTAKKETKHLRTFDGAALISYMHRKKQHFFTVKSFTDLKQLNYP